MLAHPIATESKLPSKELADPLVSVCVDTGTSVGGEGTFPGEGRSRRHRIGERPSKLRLLLVPLVDLRHPCFVVVSFSL